MDRAARPWVEGVREDLLPLIEDRRDGALKAILVNLHPADIANIISILGDEDDQRIARGMKFLSAGTVDPSDTIAGEHRFVSPVRAAATCGRRPRRAAPLQQPTESAPPRRRQPPRYPDKVRRAGPTSCRPFPQALPPGLRRETWGLGE